MFERKSDGPRYMQPYAQTYRLAINATGRTLHRVTMTLDIDP
jgi:hypothetical protein